MKLWGNWSENAAPDDHLATRHGRIGQLRSLGGILAAAMLMAGLQVPSVANAVDVAGYAKPDEWGTVKISPLGDYLAFTLPAEDRTAMIVRRRVDNKVTATVHFGKDEHIDEFTWINPERILISLATKIGKLEQPMPTGELYAVNADGGKGEFLLGQRLQARSGDTRIQPKDIEKVAGALIDDLPNDDKHVLISVQAFNEDALSKIEKLDARIGRRIPMGASPVRNARFTTDNAGVVRFVRGFGRDGISKLYYRPAEDAQWQLVNDEASSDRIELALGFSEDNKTAYLQIEHDSGPDSIVAMDVATGARKEVVRDDDSDPHHILRKPGTSIPIGVVLMDGKPRMEFFDAGSPDARLYRSLQSAFGGDVPFITSSTTDGRLVLVEVSSDRNPGDFFLFDKVAKKADLLMSRRNWFDPAKMAEMRPIALEARDGLALKGYLTLPPGSGGKQLPLVVLPHGGPFGVRDSWGFADEPQLLAAAGYAVLQVNFRGSSGYGRAFTQAGARQWGRTMQDDLTDATQWAIREGIADARRVCIYGASYGGYAALMGAAREPGLYRCAAGYVGVYDLPTMFIRDGREERGSDAVFLRNWVGDKAELDAISPNRIADRIKAPVFLAAGGEDDRAQLSHTKMMEKALLKAGVPVETLYYATEGHGFYLEANRKEFYTRLLAFLARNIGGATATTAGASGK